MERLIGEQAAEINRMVSMPETRRHGGGSPIMETIALGIEYDYETRKRLARYLAGIDKEFNDAKDLDREPTFGDGLVNERPGLKK